MRQNVTFVVVLAAAAGVGALLVMPGRRTLEPLDSASRGGVCAACADGASPIAAGAPAPRAVGAGARPHRPGEREGLR